ncbi:hypothetical protein [Peribacillus simplex]|uniref:Uncharacterized protein n=1 Tax=Peribacillus simplex TaxID=1478 RepID=A0A9W4L6Y2_9BACI|nr:hypothetical protein [Peribacillus simplex]WHX90331.1 hypothetical protein QNH50_20275 [Peribacillus simplex]CAH0293541.1 hypothetical protein SRABI133_04323 [Peribacillus simplex]
MKSLSNWSIVFAVIGTLSFCCSLALPTASELLMISGFGALVIGMLCSFGAMYKNEKGKSKFLAVAVFFLLSFILVWNEPFQIVRLLTWMKN